MIAHRHALLRAAATCLRSSSSATHQRAGMHLGRATAEATKDFLARSGDAGQPTARLRVGKRASDGVKDAAALHVSRRGVGSPYLWAKDVPRIEASKHAISSFQSNFLQTVINPYVDTSRDEDADKQAYVESLVLQELVESLDLPRNGLVLSALLTDDLVRPATGHAADQLAPDVIQRGVRRAAQEFDVETLDHVVVRIPDALLAASTSRADLHDALRRAAHTLESLQSDNVLQSYGFALSGSNDSVDRLVETVLSDVATECDHFASLQLDVGLRATSSQLPLSSAITSFRDAFAMLVIAERPFDATLSNDKPLQLTSAAASDVSGDDVAVLLQSAFNLALSVERKYADVILPAQVASNSHQLPAAEDVAWAHILAHQHAQFDNLDEWRFVRETQLTPRFEATLRTFAASDDDAIKDLGFAYAIALRELLKCFTASVELLAARRAQQLVNAAVDVGVADDRTTLEEIAVRAVLASGADVVLVQEQLGAHSTLAFETAAYTPEQLAQVVAVTESLLQAP